jgi:hypothetical protein
MFKLKPLSKEAIPAAHEKANCYRFLNEPVEAESICLDILEVEPDNQQAIITLLLSLTDQFGLILAPHLLRRGIFFLDLRMNTAESTIVG